MAMRRVVRWSCAVASVVASAVLLAGCGSSARIVGEARHSVPGNVTVRSSDASPPRLPANLVTTSGQLADLVDFHDEDFSGSWFDASDATLHIGVATRTGRALLDKRGLLDDPDVVVEDADRSLAVGQRFAVTYVRHSVLRASIVGWGALPQGDGIDLMVHGDHLTSDQLAELGALPVRVVVVLGQDAATLS